MVNITIKEVVSPFARKIQKRLKWFLALNLIAIFDTAYLTYVHFKPTPTEWCNFSARFDCDIVNKSVYAEILGVPVAILGFLTYLILLILAWLILKNVRLTRLAKCLRPGKLLWLMFGLTAAGVLFSGYLTYIELFVLHAICILCALQQVIIIIDLFVLLGILSLIDQNKRVNPNVCEFC